MITLNITPNTYSTIVSELFNSLKNDKLDPLVRLDIIEALREIGNDDESSQEKPD